MYNSFPICRTIFDNWIYVDAEYLKIWITMLGKARYIQESKKGMYQNIQYTLDYGQFIFGRLQWSKDLNIGEQKIRTCVKKLTNDNMIQIVEHKSKFTIYEIVNYAKYNQLDNQQETKEYQDVEETANHHINQQITSKKPADNQQITTNEESKELKKDKNDKDIYIPYSEIIDYLNLNAKTSYKSTSKKTQDLIKARINDKFTLENFKRVIDKKCIEWLGTDYEKYLRPETLFGTKFESYLNQKTVRKAKGNFNNFEQRQDKDPEYADNLEKQLLKKSTGDTLDFNEALKKIREG